jgi:hypothetical protein
MPDLGLPDIEQLYSSCHSSFNFDDSTILLKKVLWKVNSGTFCSFAEEMVSSESKSGIK